MLQGDKARVEYLVRTVVWFPNLLRRDRLARNDSSLIDKERIVTLILAQMHAPARAKIIELEEQEDCQDVTEAWRVVCGWWERWRGEYCLKSRDLLNPGQLNNDRVKILAKSGLRKKRLRKQSKLSSRQSE